MSGEMSKEESKATLSNAFDVRPTENVHADPSLSERHLRKGDDLTDDESEAILRIATDVRPGENFHRDD